jgi:hypothetical protein
MLFKQEIKSFVYLFIEKKTHRIFFID